MTLEFDGRIVHTIPALLSSLDHILSTPDKKCKGTTGVRVANLHFHKVKTDGIIIF